MLWKLAPGGDEIYLIEGANVSGFVRPLMSETEAWRWSVMHNDGALLVGSAPTMDAALEAADAACAQLSTAHGRLAARGRR